MGERCASVSKTKHGHLMTGANRRVCISGTAALQANRASGGELTSAISHIGSPACSKRALFREAGQSSERKKQSCHLKTKLVDKDIFRRNNGSASYEEILIGIFVPQNVPWFHVDVPTKRSQSPRLTRFTSRRAERMNRR